MTRQTKYPNAMERYEHMERIVPEIEIQEQKTSIQSVLEKLPRSTSHQ